MSVTIDSLDIQIRSSAGSAANNIDKLADSLERLKANASLTKVTNNLTKLAGALNTLRVNSSTLSSLKGLAGAMKSLAAVQSANGLKKVLQQLQTLPDLTARLNPATLTAFSAAIRKLSEGLAPLSKQLEAIGKGFAALPARISQCVTATNRLTRATREAEDAAEDHDDALDKQGVSLMAGIANFETLISTINQVIHALGKVIGSAMEWDGIQFRFGQAFGEDAQDVYDWILKINEALGISTQEFMQYSGIYASLLKGFGVEQSKLSAISVGLTELTYDIWAFSNDRYKNLEDAAEAVRSAITGEIEPIRNAGIALTEASMQEYLDTVGQAHVSIEKLTEAQKAEVRYAVMVNSAMQQGIVGTYAREMDTAEGAVRRLTQQMKTLGQAFGSLFIPLLQMAIPWITAFVDILTDAVHWLAALFGIKIAKIDWSGVSAGSTGLENIESGATDATDALGDTAKAAKKLRDYTLGFDELNVIEPPSASSGGAGGAGGGAGGAAGNGFEGLELSSLWDQALLDSATKKVDEIKAKVLGFLDEFKVQLGIIAGALGLLGLAKLLTDLGKAIGLGENFLDGVNKIKQLAVTGIILTIQWSLMDHFLENFIKEGSWKDYIWSVITGALGAFASYLIMGKTGLVLSLVVTAAAMFKWTFEDGQVDSIEEVTAGLTGLASAAGAAAIVWKKIGPAIAESNLVRSLIGIAKGSEAAKSAFTIMHPKITALVMPFVNAGKAVVGFLGGLTAPAWATIAAVIAGIVSVVIFLKNNWEEVTAAVKKFFETNIVPKLEDIKESWGKIKSALSDAKEAFLNAIPPEFREALENVGKWIKDAVGAVKELFGSIQWLEAIGAVFETIGGIIFNAISVQIASAISFGIKVIEGFVQVISGIVEIVSGVVEALIKLFSGDLEGAWTAVKKIGQGIADVFLGLYDMTIGAVVEWVKGIIDWCVALWDELVGHSIIPDLIDSIVDWFLSLPKKILTPIQNFINDIIKKFKDMWSSIKSWWKTNVAPKFTAKYWTDKFDVIRKGASEKLEAAKKAIQDKWSAIKTWFSGNVAPKFTLSFWLDKFKNLKEGFTKTIKNACNAGIDLMNKFIGWLNEKLNFSWDGLTIAGKEVFKGGSMQLFTIPKIPKLEQGGFLEDGLFTMNKGEIAGRFNNGKSVVANNQMIVDGIAQGVYRAVVSAMNDSQRGDNNVNVYLDGKQIYASVKKTENERGVKLMGSQLGYSY